MPQPHFVFTRQYLASCSPPPLSDQILHPLLIKCRIEKEIYLLRHLVTLWKFELNVPVATFNLLPIFPSHSLSGRVNRPFHSVYSILSNQLPISLKDKCSCYSLASVNISYISHALFHIYRYLALHI